MPPGAPGADALPASMHDIPLTIDAHTATRHVGVTLTCFADARVPPQMAMGADAFLPVPAALAPRSAVLPTAATRPVPSQPMYAAVSGP